MARDERKLARRLDAAKGGEGRRCDGPEFAGNPRLEFAERTRAIPYGGIGTMLWIHRGIRIRIRIPIAPPCKRQNQSQTPCACPHEGSLIEPGPASTHPR